MFMAKSGQCFRLLQILRVGSAMMEAVKVLRDWFIARTRIRSRVR